MKETYIGECSIFYGNLLVKKDEGKYYWCIEDYPKNEWYEIAKYLYDTLIKYEKETFNNNNC